MDLFEPLPTIHEESLYEDSVVHINNEDSASGEFTPEVLKKAQDDPLLQHWINLCTENIKMKKNLESELLYAESTGMISKELLEQTALFELHERLCELECTHEQLVQESTLLSKGQCGTSSAPEKVPFKQIHAESDRSQSMRGITKEKRKRVVKDQSNERIWEEERSERKITIKDPVTHPSRPNELPNLQNTSQKQDEKDRSHPVRGIAKERTKRVVKDQSNEGIWEEERRERKKGNKITIKDPVTHPPRPNELPKLQNTSQQKRVNSYSSQQTNPTRICKLPEIHTPRTAQIRPDHTFPSASDPTQTALPKITQRHKHNISEKKPSALQTCPDILPPLMKIPQTQQDIRKAFQAPKRKKKQAHTYDILIINNEPENIPNQ